MIFLFDIYRFKSRSKMKFEITFGELEEMVLCIIHCNLNEDDALEYARAFITNSDKDLYQDKSVIDIR